MANPSDNAVLLDDLYGNNKLTDKYKIAMGIADYLKNNKPIPVENPEYVFYYIPENDVDEHIKFVLGDNVKYKPQDVFIMKDDICGLDNSRLSVYDKMKSIYERTSLKEQFRASGLEVAS